VAANLVSPVGGTNSSPPKFEGPLSRRGKERGKEEWEEKLERKRTEGTKENTPPHPQ